MILKKDLDQSIPFLFQRFVHGEYPVGDTGSTDKLLFLKPQIQKHAGNILCAKAAAGLFYGALLILGRQLEYKLKTQRSPGSLNKLETDRAKQGKRADGCLLEQIILCIFRTEKIRVQMTVDGMGHIGADRSLRQQKMVKEIGAQQLVHKVLNIYELKCDHRKLLSIMVGNYTIAQILLNFNPLLENSTRM